jgi:hypothetical protein
METEYVTFNPPRTAAVRMTRGPWFLSRIAGAWRFEVVNPMRTRVHFQYSFRTRPRCLSWLLTPLMSRAFARDTRRRLVALKQAVSLQGQPPPAGQSGTSEDGCTTGVGVGKWDIAEARSGGETEARRSND